MRDRYYLNINYSKPVVDRLAIVGKAISKHTIKSFELILVESYPVQNGGGT